MSDKESHSTETSNESTSQSALSWWWRCLMFWRNVFRRFEARGGFIHASSLSYTSLVGMIPVLAVGFSVATSLMVKDGEEGREQVQEWIEKMIQTVAPMLDLEVRDEAVSTAELPLDTEAVKESEVAFEFNEKMPPSSSSRGGQRQEVARRIADYVGEIHTKTIGVTSVCVFLVVAILLLRAIERTFNNVWGIPKNRSWGAGVAQYWAGLTLGPFLFVLGTSLSTSNTLKGFSDYFQKFGAFGTLFLFLTSWFFTGASCALIYRIMTNTRMTFKAASCGGLTAGLLLQLNSQLPVVYYSNVATSNKVYGSLAAVPILLLGLYVSWIILIFGSHVAFMVQHPNQGSDEEDASPEDHAEHSALTAVRVMQLIASRFQAGEQPYTSAELADRLQLDHAIVHDSVALLSDSGLVFRGEESSSGLSLGKPAEGITLKDIFQVIEKDMDGKSKVGSEDACFDVYQNIIRDRDQSAATVKLSDLV